MGNSDSLLTVDAGDKATVSSHSREAGTTNNINELIQKADVIIKSEQETFQQPFQEDNPNSGQGGYLPVPPPFPVDAFPMPYQQVIQEIAQAYAVPVEVPCVALLSGSGACIGSTRGLTIKTGWDEYANLWIATVGLSGLGKSPAIMAIFRHIYELEQRWAQEHREALKCYEAKLTQSRKDKDQQEPGDPPKWRQLIVDDATTEGLTDALDANQRGILWNRDEMAGFIQDIDRYIQRDAGTKTRLMSSYDSGPWKVNRRDKTKNCFLPHATVSIMGSIQPAVLPKIFSSLDAASGFLPRFLFVWAVREIPPFWTDATVSQESKDFLSKSFDRLLRLDFQEDGEPYRIKVSLAAKESFVDWFNLQAAEPWFKEDVQIFEALNAKLRGQCLRICLILHCLESAESGLSELREVSISTMQNAIKIANILKIHQKNTWQYILSEGAVLDLNPIQKRVARAILQLEPEIEGGMLPTARITEVVNVGMAEGFRFSGTKVGKIASGLGFKPQKLPDGKARGIVIEAPQLEKYKSLLNVSQVS
jgi:Protein of unknown function (DUF3987)